MKELLLTSFAYNRWATARILKLAVELSDKQLDKETNHSHGSLRALLFHMYSTEWTWRNLSQNCELSFPRPKSSHYPSLEALRTAWEEEERLAQAFLEEISQDDLTENLELRNPRGGTQIFTRWQMLTHLLLHSMGHRSEAANILTALGRLPGDLDMIFYLIEKNHPS
jgi:uncharacterized damage-inducible protein DinB